MTQRGFRNHLFAGLGLWLLLAAAYTTYLPGTLGPFILDDLVNLEALSHYGTIDSTDKVRQFIFGNESGRSGRPISMASFLLDDNAWPTRPFSFKKTNILLHLIGGCLVFWLGICVFSTPQLQQKCGTLFPALALTALWTLHPLHTSTVLYVVQRMAELSAIFVLLGIILYMKGRIAVPAASQFLLCAAGSAMILAGVFAKENAILGLALICALEFTVLRTVRSTRIHRFAFIALAATPFAAFLAYLLVGIGSWLPGYEYRDFSLSERLLTQPRILFDYLRLILAYSPGGTGVYHDDFPVSETLFVPRTTVLALAGLAVGLICAWVLRKKLPILSLGILWFLCSHLLESTVLPLELYFEHRNYLAMIGPLLTIAGILAYLRVQASDLVLIILSPLILAMVLILMLLLLHQSVSVWSSPATLFTTWEVENPRSLRAKRTLADYMNITGDAVTALRLTSDAIALNPRDASSYLLAFEIACRHELSLPLTVDEYISRASTFEISDGLNGSLLALAQQVSSEPCPAINNSDLLRIAVATSEIPELDLHRDRAAQIHNLVSEVYTLNRDFAGARQHLEHVWKLQPTVSVALRLATLLTSAGKHHDALVYIQFAKQADDKRRPGTPSRSEQLLFIEKSIRQEIVAH